MRKSLMRMTLRQLQIFNEVCDLRSYSRAAEEMSLTQPAVSLQIRQLEELIGQPLFDYVGKKLYMTEAAEALNRIQIQMGSMSAEKGGYVLLNLSQPLDDEIQVVLVYGNDVPPAAPPPRSTAAPPPPPSAAAASSCLSSSRCRSPCRACSSPGRSRCPGG